jgi:hypothetical protein
MKKKISDFKVDDDIEFYFLDMPQNGKVIEVLTKEQTIKIRTTGGIIHNINLTDKESKFISLK